jgi:hypothetical protein
MAATARLKCASTKAGWIASARSQDAEHMQGVDLLGIGQKDLLIGGLGPIQLSLLVQRRRLAEGLGQHGLGLRVTRIKHSPGPP